MASPGIAINSDKPGGHHGRLMLSRANFRILRTSWRWLQRINLSAIWRGTLDLNEIPSRSICLHLMRLKYAKVLALARNRLSWLQLHLPFLLAHRPWGTSGSQEVVDRFPDKNAT